MSIPLVGFTDLTAQCPPPSADIVISGTSSTDYTLNAGDTLHITTTGNYTGEVTISGGVFYNCATAPQNLKFTTTTDGPVGRAYNYGTLNFTGSNDHLDSEIYNYGTINKTGDLVMDVDGKLFNHGTLDIGGKFTTKTSGEWHNYGSITSGGDMKIELGGGVYNYTGGTISTSKAIIDGYIYNAGNISIDTHYDHGNTGTVDVDGGCFHITGNFSNHGVVNGITCGTMYLNGGGGNNTGSITAPLSIVNPDESTHPFLNSNSGSVDASVVGVSCGCSGPVENCSDGIDNDGDGLIDCADPDCNGSVDCSDNDNDGITDAIDLDDDNDGILDTDEDLVVKTSFRPACNAFALDFTTPGVLVSGTDLLEGAVYKYTAVSAGVDAKVTIIKQRNQTSTTVDDNGSDPSYFKPMSSFVLNGIGDQSYTEFLFEFVTGVGEAPVIVPELFINFNDIDGSTDHGEQNWVQLPTSYTEDDPTDLTTVLGDWVLGSSGTIEYVGASNLNPQANFSARYINKSSFSIRVGVENRIAGANSGIRAHSVEFACVDNFVNPTTYLMDLDEDGYPNFTDIDSDNDGIYDCVESNSGQAHSGGMLTGGVDSLGIPLSVSNGSGGVNYIYADSDADNTLNAFEIDSDGDSCNDVIEAGFPDADGDGQLGGLVPPTVDGNGVITSGGL